MKSVTKPIVVPFHANSQGHDPFNRWLAPIEAFAARSNSDCRNPFGQVMRATSALVASPRPKCTTGAPITCFCTCRPVRTSTSPPIPNELIR